MATNKDEQARIVISELSKIPKFKSMKDPAARNRLIERAIQDKFGIIQKSGNILQNMIRSQRIGGVPATGLGAIPSTMEEASDIYPAVYHGANQAGFGAVDIARNLDNRLLGRDREAPQAETQYGKSLQNASSLAGTFFGGPGKVGSKIGSGIASKIPNYLGKTLGRVAEGASIGALSPGNVEERMGHAATGSVVNPLVGSALDPLVPMAKKIITNLMKPGDILKTRPTFAEDVLDKNLIGSEQEISGKAQDLFTSSENKLQQMISGQKQKVNMNNVLDRLSEVKRKAMDTGDTALLNEIDRVETAIRNKIDDVQVQESTQFQIPQGSSSVSESPNVVIQQQYQPTGFEIKQGSSSRSIEPELNVRNLETRRFGDMGEELSPKVQKKVNVRNVETNKSSPGYSSRTAKKLPSKVSVIKSKEIKGSPGFKGPETSVTKTVKDPYGYSSLEKSNQLKRDFYSQTPNREFYQYSEEPSRIAASGLKSEIEGALPNLPIKATNQDIALGSQVKKLMSKRMVAQAGKNPISLLDAIIGIFGGVKGGKPLETGGLLVLKHALSSSTARSGIAKLIYEIGRQSASISKGATVLSTQNRK